MLLHHDGRTEVLRQIAQDRLQIACRRQQDHQFNARVVRLG
ncbi:hypothetical protein [Mycobacterium tilburgii]|nr:hypothetical protein [Mycobacterium tilburgii]